MIEWHTVSLLIVLHFIGDFILQTDKMAINKSTSNKWLSYHVLAYSLPFIIIHPMYALINAVLHWVTDYVTSRVASKMHLEGKRGLFFKTIGFDQMVHMLTLFMTYIYLFGEF